jgi:streptogramin lyase
MRLSLLAAMLVLSTPALAGSRPAPVETDVLAIGKAPCGLAAEGDGLWIAVYEAGVLVRIAGDRVVERIRVGRWSCAVTADRRAVWVARDRARELVRVDRKTRRISRTRLGGMPFGVVLAGGSVFASGNDTGTVWRVDPRTARVTRIYAVGAKPTGLAACGGRVWVGHGEGATVLTSIHPTSHRIRRVAVGEDSPRAPRCVRGELWVTTLDTVLRIDARTGRVLSRLKIGETLGNAALGPDGLVWVTDKQNSVVHRLDARGRRVVDGFPAGPGAFALARAGEAMWVTSFAGVDVRRYDP